MPTYAFDQYTKKITTLLVESSPFYATSRPYPVVVEETADVAAQILSGALWRAPLEEVVFSAAPTAGSLSLALNSFTTPMENINILPAAILDGELLPGLTSFTAPIEAADISVSILSGTLEPGLVNITYGTEAMNVEVAQILEGTLT